MFSKFRDLLTDVKQWTSHKRSESYTDEESSMEEWWGSGKKPKMHGVRCIHYYRIQYSRQARNI